VPVDGDQRHAMLDEASGKQSALAELGAAIPVAHRRGLRIQVERALRLRRQDHVEGALLMGVHGTARQKLISLTLEMFEQAAPLAKSLQRNFARRRQCLDAEVGPARILEDAE